MSEVGQDLITALQEVQVHRKKQTTNVQVTRFPELYTDVRALRRDLGMSQTEFSASFGIQLATLKHWEQGKREPQGPAKALLHIISQEPQAVLRAFSSVMPTL
ncbi:MAG: helix-turn-helix domain-containing protein [Cyanobacteria bacterium P01_A01_bin.17]